MFHATHLSLQRTRSRSRFCAPTSNLIRRSASFEKPTSSPSLNIATVSRCSTTVCSQEGFHFMAMQLLKGHVLSKELGRPDGPDAGISAAGRRVARARARARTQRRASRPQAGEPVPHHRRRRQRDVIKLLDFGIAKFKQPTDSADGAVTLSGLMAGTPAYMSPEQVIGADTDERTDLYSAGVIFYEMLAGGLPFDTDDPVVLLHHQLNEEFPPLPDSVPAPLQEAVRRMCDKEKAKRYSSASDVIADIEAYLYDATDGGFAASSSSTRRWTTGAGASSIPSVRNRETVTDVPSLEEPANGRPWWHWGVAAGLILLAGGIALPRVMGGGQAVNTNAAAVTEVAPAVAQAPAEKPATDDRSGFLSLLAKVNDPDHPLPFDARKQSLQTLAGSEYASKIDTRLHTGLDLVQAAESPTPCATFHDALAQIQESEDSYYVAYLSQAEVPARGPTEPAQACKGLDTMLAKSRKSLIAEDEPQEEEVRRVAAVTRSSKRRAARRRSRPDAASDAPTPSTDAPAPQPEPSPPVEPAKAPEPVKAEKIKPPPKLPRTGGRKSSSSSKSKSSGKVTKLDQPDIRGL